MIPTVVFLREWPIDQTGVICRHPVVPESQAAAAGGWKSLAFTPE